MSAGRPAGAGEPLNVPVVLASTFHAATGSLVTGPGNGSGSGGAGREYARDDATPGWEALEQVLGELEGGAAVSFSSGMAAIAAVLDLLPTGAHVVAPTDCYTGVRALLNDGRRQGRWSVRALWEQRMDALHTEVARGKRERRTET